MLAICSWNRYSVVLDRVIQYLSGDGTFPGRVCSRVIISHSISNSGGVVVGGRLGRTTAHKSHANIPYSWRIPPSRQGFNVLFCFIHQGRSVHLFQRVFGAFGGCLPVLAGVCRFWRSPRVEAQGGAHMCECVCESVCVRERDPLMTPSSPFFA